jgi:hypothetical protein
MMRTTPWRLITLQCSQIGLTLLRTFTRTPIDVQISRWARGGFSELAFEITGSAPKSSETDPF